jgi:hypothetical protein
MSPHPLIVARLENAVRAVCQLPTGEVIADHPSPLAVYPGSFNPLHHGHRALAEAAGKRLGVEVHFELSVANADKPELSAEEVARRVSQFRDVAPVWVTRAAAFEKKADLFPGAAFVLGFDTAVRLVDARYYANDSGKRDAALRKLLKRGCRVLVGGRVDAAGVFREWDGSGVAAEFDALFEPIPAFRVDVSSSALRSRGAGGIEKVR